MKIIRNWFVTTFMLMIFILIDQTNAIVEITKFHERLVQVSALSKKPSEEIFTRVKNFIQERVQFIDKEYIAKRKLDLQAKALKEGSSTFFWIFTVINFIFYEIKFINT